MSEPKPDRVECPACEYQRRMKMWRQDRCVLCSGSWYVSKELAEQWQAQQLRADLLRRLRDGAGAAFVAGNEDAARLLREAADYLDTRP